MFNHKGETIVEKTIGIIVLIVVLAVAWSVLSESSPEGITNILVYGALPGTAIFVMALWSS